MEIDLSGKVALVLGGSQGIGRAVCVTLASAKCQIVVVARRESVLKTLVESLPSTPGQAHHYLALDIVADKPRLLSELQNLLSRYGQFDIVVNNTAGPAAGPITDATDEAFLSAFNQHLLVSQAIAQLVLPGMRANHYGRIINILSTSVKAPIANLGVSNTIRAAVAQWGKTLANEVACDGVTVNSVLPGYTRTERLQSLLEATAQRTNQTNEAVSEAWRQTIPLKRFASPEEIANVILFLASPFASYVTGVALPVDGGRTPCF